MFFCRFRRKGEAMDHPFGFRQKVKNNTELLRTLTPWVKEAHAFHWEEKHGKIFGYTFPVAQALPQLKGRLRLLKKGLTVGKMHRQGMNPSHELALCHCLSPSVPRIGLNLGTAQAYLRKEEVSPQSTSSPGWVAASYQGVVLGWLKLTGAGWKNYYPVNWRVKSQSL